MKNIALKVANMRNEQSFTLYPYNGGDTLYLQSDKRFIIANIRNGECIINDKNTNYANSFLTQMNPIKFNLEQTILVKIQEFLWNNNGKDGNINGVVTFANKQLFSN